ncbi:MAG: DUF2357 domain-containing protein [Lysinibacillus sp.]
MDGMTKERELLVIGTEEVTVVLKGKLDTSKHRSATGFIPMTFSTDAVNADIQIYNRESGQLTPFEPEQMAPIFFENGNYELIILPETGDDFSFFHEYEAFRNAVTKLSRSNLITGNLHFRNEVGLSTMEIRKNGEKLFSFTIEVFPTKLDYRKDYTALLDEVSAEVYNLAFSFIRRTYLRASRKRYTEPSLAEFYRILQEHFDEYMTAIKHIEGHPHHQLETTYEEVRGDRLRKQDSRGRAYLRKNAHRFVDSSAGLKLGSRTVLPEKGLLMKRQQTYDTHENRYVKWSMNRIHARIGQVREEVLKSYRLRNVDPDPQLLDLLNCMRRQLDVHLKKALWKGVGRLDRSVYSLVMQMGTGYREVFQIHAILSQSLVLHGEIYKMSVKDIATLYEYWTFLKLGQILSGKCLVGEQDVVKLDRRGLFVNLKQDQTATRTFKHPKTKEKVILRYQYSGDRLPTVQQRPDSMLSIEKRGKDYLFQYIFDAKYRVDVEGKPGPQQDDINTMHRYRDSIVVEQGGKYERSAFGAYVLFPWNNEEEYRNHPLYRSIEKVNIGGLPFLPDHTALVEEIIDNLLNKSADELQREGILPRGTISYLQEQEGIMLLIHCSEQLKSEKEIPLSLLPEGWQEISAMASATYEGVKEVAEVVSYKEVEGSVVFQLAEGRSELKPTAVYSVEEPTLIWRNSFYLANTLGETLIKPGIETELLKKFRSLSPEVSVELDQTRISNTSRVVAFMIGKARFELQSEKLMHEEKEISLQHSLDKVLDEVKSLMERKHSLPTFDE